MESILMGRSTGNHALITNPPNNADRHLTTHGSDWLWAVFTIFGLALLSWLAWTLMRHKGQHGATSSKHTDGDNIDMSHGNHGSSFSSVYGERIMHYLWALAAFIGFITYFTMASDLGNAPVRQYMHNGGNQSQTRQIYYARYIYWALAWPLIITANLLISGVSWATIFFAIALQEIWVVSWLCGALVATSYKWGYFVFGLFAYFLLAYVMLAWGMEHAKRVHTSKEYGLLASILVLAWAAFPICWGLSEGSNKLSVTGEMVFYGILDLIAVPIYGTLFLLTSRKVSSNLIHFTQVGRTSGVDGISPHYNGTGNGVRTGTNNGVQGGVNNGVATGGHNGVHTGAPAGNYNGV